MSVAKTGDTVKVHYTGKLADGTVFDSSVNREPLEFTIGDGKLIPGFDRAVNGMKVGEKTTVTIPAEEAYGPRYDQLVQIVNKTDLPPELNPEVGQHLEAVQQDGNVINVTVTNVDENSITIDANHPLAGKELIFELELVEIVK
jgi:peptidylprolyl isomerase